MYWNMDSLIETALKILPAIKFQLVLSLNDVYWKCGMSYFGLPIALFFHASLFFLGDIFLVLATLGVDSG